MKRLTAPPALKKVNKPPKFYAANINPPQRTDSRLRHESPLSFVPRESRATISDLRPEVDRRRGSQ